MKDGELILSLGQQIIDLKAERAKLREALRELRDWMATEGYVYKRDEIDAVLKETE